MDEDLESVLNAIMDTQETLLKTVTELVVIVRRMEDRQVKTTAMVKEVKVHEAPVVGTFGTAEKTKS